MILDLDRFVDECKPRWQELQVLLDRLENGALHGDLDALERCYQLYERACADLAKLSTFAAVPEVQRYLDDLVARAYAEINETRGRKLRFAPIKLLFYEFPRVFRKFAPAFGLAVLMTVTGGIFGAGALLVDPSAKRVLIPFHHLHRNPSQRVESEEVNSDEILQGARAAFSAQLIAHNTRVGIFAFALGMTFGIGTMVLLFYNGVILGAVCFDYIVAGEGVFLAGWLLPHGMIEIPAILIAGQAGLVLAQAFLKRCSGGQSGSELRRIAPDLVALASGFTMMLVWAGFVESFLSQTHQPVFPYGLKIGFGVVELVLLILFLSRAGRHIRP